MNKQSGFTIIEVLLALFILTSSMYVLTDVQLRTLRHLKRGKELIDRIYLVKKSWYQLFMNEHDEEKVSLKDKKYKDPECVIASSWKRVFPRGIKKPKQEDENAADKKTVVQYRSVASWTSGIFDEQLPLIGFRYCPKDKEKPS